MEKLEKRVGKTLPFEVPTGYFEKLDGQILSCVGEACGVDFKEKKADEKISGFRLFLNRSVPYISMAAIVSFVVVMMQLFVFGNDKNAGVVDEGMAEIEAYQFEENIEVTDEQIIEYLSRSVYDVESFLASMQ